MKEQGANMGRAEAIIKSKQDYYKRIDEIRAAGASTFKVENQTAGGGREGTGPDYKNPSPMPSIRGGGASEALRRNSDTIFMNNLIKSQMRNFKQYQHLKTSALNDEHFKLAVP